MIDQSTVAIAFGGILLYSLVIVCLCLSGLIKTNKRTNILFYIHATLMIVSFVSFVISLSTIK